MTINVDQDNQMEEFTEGQVADGRAPESARESAAPQQDDASSRTPEISAPENDKIVAARPLSHPVAVKISGLCKFDQYHPPRDEDKDASRASFQIIWENLAFEVNPKSYDQVISGAFSRLRSVVCGSGPTTSESGAAPTRRTIFENLNGYVKSGEITAILGPSGVGKSTLLNVISGRCDNYRGSVQLMGGPPGKRLRSVVIPQKDYLFDKLTVSETLHFASRFMNPDKSFNHEANVERVVATLNLSKCLHSSVSSISGGEHKRVSIAQELLSRPDILILDEPTSGLDSLSCKNLIRTLQSLIELSQRDDHDSPLAIVTTIHQPDIEVFNMFDHVYCLATGGLLIYDGLPSQVLEVIESRARLASSATHDKLLLRTTELAQTVNPANLLIEIASGEYGPAAIESLAKLHAKPHPPAELPPAGDTDSGSSDSTAAVSAAAEINSNQGSAVVRLNNPEAQSSYSEVTQFKPDAVGKRIKDKRLSQMARSFHGSGLFLYHTNLLARRSLIKFVRDPMVYLTSFMWHLMIPIGLWLAYPKTLGTTHGCPLIIRDMDTMSLVSNRTLHLVEDLQNQLSVTYECASMFFVTVFALSVCGVIMPTLTFPMNMQILRKEASNGWYSVNAFATADTIASFPHQALFPAACMASLYWLLGLPGSPMEWRLSATVLVIVLHSLINQATGLIFGALMVSSAEAAIFMSFGAILPQSLLSGYTARIESMPHWLQSLKNFSPFYHALQLCNLIRFGFGMCPCDESTDGLLLAQEPQFGDIPDQVKSVFSYYLRSSLLNNETEDGRLELGEKFAGSNMYLGLKLNASERADMAKKLDADEIDLFTGLARQMSRSFAYGSDIDSCQSIRSQPLRSFYTPPDDEMWIMFAQMAAILVVLRIVLYFVIRLKSRASL